VHVDALLREFGAQGLDDLGARRILNGQYPGGMDTDRIAAVLRDASGQLVLEVRKTMDFFRATSPVERVSRIVLSGGGWQALGLVDQLAAEFNAPVDVFDPFRKVSKSARSVGAEAAGPAYAVAVGLAMRQGEGR
jgi:type IV pilus assembly protein PilM